MVNITRSHSIPPFETADFLPPVSRWTSLSGLALVSTIGLTIGLAAIVRYNVVVRANATIRPAGELRVVQAEVEGSIRQIAVEDYQTVKQGQVIAYLDDTKLQIQKSQLQGSIRQNQTQLDQVAAQIRYLDTQILAESYAADRAITAAQAETIRNQREHTERRLITQAEVDEAQVATNQARDELNRYQSLAEAGAVSQLQLKEKESAVQSAEARLNRARAALNPTDASVVIAQESIAQEQARGQATVANLQREREALGQRQAEIQSQLLREQKDLEQVERELHRSLIRATSDGTILNLTIQNPNQVVRPGENIAQIVPADTALVVKASVANQDIDQVEVGQPTQVRVDACPYSDYGTLKGVVQTIAPDIISAQPNPSAATNSQASSSGNFAVTIKITDQNLTNGSQQCQIQPGMQATASIISRQETFLQFVLRKARLWTDL